MKVLISYKSLSIYFFVLEINYIIQVIDWKENAGFLFHWILFDFTR